MLRYPITIFVDSADRVAAEPWLKSGIASGITTNPTILKRSASRITDIPVIYRWAKDAGAQEVCFQTWGASSEEWYANAMRIRSVAEDAVIKVPGTLLGAPVIKRLHAQEIPVLMTAGYNQRQLLIGSALHARYFAPYFSRMNNLGRDALNEFRRMTEIVPQDGSDTLIMAASVKTGRDVVSLAAVGVRAFTLSPSVLTELITDNAVDQAVAVFEKDMADVVAND
jgi:transaldolase